MSNVFDLYSGKVAKDRNARSNDDDRSPLQKKGVVYAACLLAPEGQQPKRLALYLHNGAVQMPSYASLVDMFVTSHQEISLVFEHAVMNIKGEYLYEIIDHLQYERAESLGCFDENDDGWIKPEEGQPIIDTIEHETLAAFYLRYVETDLE